MGKGNAAVKQWMSRPERFADLFNGIIFQGAQVVLPEELEPAEGETDILLADKAKKVQEIHRYRDIVMRWEKGAILTMLACENQEKVHYAMTVRNMLYDSLSYTSQIQQLWKSCAEEEKGNISASEFLSRFGKEDKLIPVITLVFYYDVEKWDGSVDLYGMLRWSESEEYNKILQKYIPNYQINLVDAGNLRCLERFQTDLQEILGMLQCRRDKEKLLSYMRDNGSYFRNVDEETYHVIREFLHSEKILKKQIKHKQGKETVDMCKALEDLYNDGIMQGTIETLKEVGLPKPDVIERIMQKFDISTEKAEQEVEKYWK